DTVSIKEAAWRTIPDAFMHASANNTLPATARQIMYAGRRKIPQMADRELGGTFDKYFTQTLLPDYVAERRPAWASSACGSPTSKVWSGRAFTCHPRARRPPPSAG